MHAPASCDCPDCGARCEPLGEDVSEHARLGTRLLQGHPTCAPEALLRPLCAGDPAAGAVAADRARHAGPGLLAQVIVAKYADHCPLYRQQGIYRRSGVELDRATLAAWVGECGARCSNRWSMRSVAMCARPRRCTPTTRRCRCSIPDAARPRPGRLWTYVRDDRPAGSRDPPAVWYRYSPDRKGEHPQAHLRRFRGILQADAYAGFAALYERSDRGGGVLGARATQVLRHLRGGSLADRRRGDAAHRRAVRDRARDSRPAARCAPRGAAGARRAAARCACTPGSRRRCRRCRQVASSPARSSTRWCAGRR